MIFRRRRACPPVWSTEVAGRAMEYVLHQWLIDRYWEELQEVSERPDVQEAEATIMRALADALSPARDKKPRKAGFAVRPDPPTIS